MKHVFLAFAVMMYSPVNGTGGANVDNPDPLGQGGDDNLQVLEEEIQADLVGEDDDVQDTSDAQSPEEATLLDDINSLDDSGADTEYDSPSDNLMC